MPTNTASTARISQDGDGPLRSSKRENRRAAMTLFESLKQYTTIVADTGDIEALARHRPLDATTNPSLLYHAAQMPAYHHLVEEAVEAASQQAGGHDHLAEAIMDHLLDLLG